MFHYSNIPASHIGSDQSRIPLRTHASAQQLLWLSSRRVDFWLASAGASAALLAAMLVILWHGDSEIDALDLVLSELHLGATYHAVIQRRLWRRLPVDVLLVPLVIVIVTYALWLSGHAMLLTSIAMYAAVWHRGRQSFGVGHFYQRAVGGPVSRMHECLFRGAAYLPMAASALAYAHLAPTHYEGKPYFAPSISAEFVIVFGFAAALCVGTYLFYVLGRNLGAETANAQQGQRIHPGEWWVVLAHAVAFGSSYILGASNAAFLFVLAVHHEVQYLHFTYAVSRQRVFSRRGSVEVARAAALRQSAEMQPTQPSEWRHAAAFSVWPVIGFVGMLAGGWFALPWLAPLGTGGLFCHYWLDGRIWTRRALHS
jgi:hypothetical protein